MRRAQVAKIKASDGASFDYFGSSVVLRDETAIVGAFNDDDNGDDSGSAYVFQRDRSGPDHWGQVTKITAGDGSENDFFGVSVSFAGGMGIIGAHREDSLGFNSGSVYVFTISDAFFTEGFESGDTSGWSVTVP